MEGVRINDLPKFLAEDPYEKYHSIIVNDTLKPNEPLVTPLALKWVTSYLPSRKPRVSEYEDESTLHINLTSKAPVWEPSETSFSEQEDTMTDFRGYFINNETIIRGLWIINPLSAIEDHAVDFTDDNNFIRLLTLRSMWLRLGILMEAMELPQSSCTRSGLFRRRKIE